MPTEATAAAVTTAAATGPQAWPTELAQQMHALRDAATQDGQPVSAAQVAAGFKRLKADKVEPLLATLAALSLVRHTPEG